MGETGIPYLTKVWNVTRGCSHISEGCTNCYAAGMAARFNGPRLPHDGLTDKGRWNGKVKLLPEKLEEPRRWRKHQTVGVCFMSDFFHEAVPDEFIDEAFEVMAVCQKHTFLLLTKRPDRLRAWEEDLPNRRPIPGMGVCTGGSPFCMGEYCKTHDAEVGWCGSPWPLPNVWIGVTVENQTRADERIPLLLATPAARHWVSYEPALGPVNLMPWLDGGDCRIGGCGYATAGPGCDGAKCDEWMRPLDWLVGGCESGPHARPASLDWFRQARDQCQAVRVPFYLKQMQVGGKLIHLPELDGRQWLEVPS